MQVGFLRRMKSHDLNYFNKFALILLAVVAVSGGVAHAQVNTRTVTTIGRNALFAGDYILSIQYFNQVIAQNPNLAEPFLLRAMAKMALDDWTGCQDDATRCIEINPYVHGSYHVRAVARQYSRLYEQAIDDYKKALDMAPASSNLLVDMAMCELELGHYYEADSCLILAQRQGAALGRTSLALAMVSMRQGHYDDALDHLSQAIVYDKNRGIQALTMRSNIFFTVKHDTDKAVADIEQAITLQPLNAELYINRSFLRYHYGDLKGAIDDLDLAIGIDNSSMRAHYNRALLLLLDGNEHRAALDCDFVLKNAGATAREAELPKAMKELKQAKAGAKQPEPELLLSRYSQQLLPLVRFEVQDPDNKAGRKRVFQPRMGDFDKAIDSHAMALGCFSLSYYATGSVLGSRSHIMKEMIQLNDAHVLKSALTLTCGATSLTAYEAGDRFVSVDRYNGIVASGQPRAVDYFARAMDFMLLRNIDAAIDDATSAIALDPNFMLAHFLRFNALFLKFGMEESEADIDATRDGLTDARRQALMTDMLGEINTVIKLSPSNPYALYNRALLHTAAADYSSALIYYSKAIDIRPDLGEAYFNRALVYLALDDKEHAIADLSKAGELGVAQSYSILKQLSK